VAARYQASLAADERVIISQATLSFQPSKTARGPLIAGVAGGTGGILHLTDARMAWCPPPARLEAALPAEPQPLVNPADGQGDDGGGGGGGPPPALSVPLRAIAFVERPAGGRRSQ
jgi:hypothetical protein